MVKGIAMKALPPLSGLISLKGKKASITASALGIGKAMAYRFAEAGADLELVDVNERGLRSVARELSGFAVEINIHKVDLPSQEEVATWCKRLEGKELDILLNKWGKCWVYLA
jgi:short-subunit dehydrogenase